MYNFMARTKSKDWEPANYSLAKGVKETVKTIAEFQGLSASDMIEFLVKNWDAGVDPSNRLNLLLGERKVLKKQLDDLDDKIEKVTNQIKFFDDWKKQKLIHKGKAMMILKRKILHKEYDEAENMAKFWSKKTGIPAIELIAEATSKVEESGV